MKYMTKWRFLLLKMSYAKMSYAKMSLIQDTRL